MKWVKKWSAFFKEKYRLSEVILASFLWKIIVIFVFNNSRKSFGTQI